VVAEAAEATGVAVAAAIKLFKPLAVAEAAQVMCLPQAQWQSVMVKHQLIVLV
jgi:hypothetical protein